LGRTRSGPDGDPWLLGRLRRASCRADGWRVSRDRGTAQASRRPYHPQTKGKAEAFVKIIINEWAYATAYPNNAERAEDLDPFLRYYNLNRPHGGIGGNTPISRVH
jgi:transposase InsO family protein